MNRSILVIFIFALFGLFSCQEDETLDQLQLVDTESTSIFVEETNDHIIIHVEVLSDITDNRNGEVNTRDYCNISFDINSNNQIDSEIDFGYESPTNNYEICSYYFLDEGAITHCGGHATSAIFTGSFAASERKAIPHMIWTLTISKDELNQKRKLSFVVKTIDAGIFSTFPITPKNENPLSFDFSETLTFQW